MLRRQSSRNRSLSTVDLQRKFHDLVLGSISHIAITPNVFAEKPYDAEKDFTPVIHLVEQPSVLAAHPTFAPRTVTELIAYAKSK
jgi:tripartite-type tricarboxylate transporter receptor subunit TctC